MGESHSRHGHGGTWVVSLSAPTFSSSVSSSSPVPVRSKGRSAPPHLCLTTEKERKYAGENLCFKICSPLGVNMQMFVEECLFLKHIREKCFTPFFVSQ